MAGVLARDFEPAWQSVRPVPTVTIDFGNGRVKTRTLHGNVAGLVVTPRGELVDAIPGILTPRAYQAELAKGLAIARSLTGGAADAEAFRTAHLAHAGAALALARPPRRMDMAKAAVELPTKNMMFQGEPADEPPPADPLERDTQQNLRERRPQIHRKLAQAGLVRPATLVRWLYREVLHADLDDPYLGLGPMLERAEAPFAGTP